MKTAPIRALLTLTLLLPILGPAVGKQHGSAMQDVAVTAPVTAPEPYKRLSELDTAISNQRKRLDALTSQVSEMTDVAEKTALELQINETKERISRLRQAIEQVIIGGVDTSAIFEQPSEKIDWRAELEQISLPLLATLRDLTAKPRRIEALRQQEADAERKLQVIEKALASIEPFETAGLPKSVQERVNAIANEWRSRDAEIRQNLEVTRLQLANLSGQTTSVWSTLRAGAAEFAQGRGLTIALALAFGITTWLVLRGLLRLYERAVVRRRGRARTTRLRVVEYAFRAITFLLVTLAVIGVFYVRSDLLLMALSIAIILGLALGLRQIVPRYIRETRLLLDIGPVHEGERVIIAGVPFKVVALNVYSILKNPRLDGLLRVPLSAFEGMTSRPDRDEPWFPTRRGDFVLLNDGRLAQVLRQSVEFVQLKIAECIVLLSSADFLHQGVRNLTANGYGLFVTFGIDYGHQEMALDEPPEAFRNAVATELERAELTGHLRDLAVEFKEAGASSLNYHISLSIDGSGAPLYFKLGRLVQRACVNLCNERGWIIPFDQLTLHPGGEMAKLAASVFPSPGK